MEGSDGDPFRGTLSQRGLQPSAQLFRSTVGESDGGNLTRTYPPLLHQPENPFDEGACFAGAGARRHRHRPFLRRHRGALLLVERKGLRRLPRHLPAGRGLLGRLFRGGAALRRRFPEQAHLPVESLPLPRGNQPDFPVFPVEAGAALDLPGPQPPDSLPHAGTGSRADVLKRRLPQDGKLRPERPQHPFILGPGLHPRGGNAVRGGDDLLQRHKALKSGRAWPDIALFAVGQLLDPVQHPDRNLSAADRAAPSRLGRFGGRHAPAAGAVAVHVVFSLLREKFEGPH